MPALKKVLLTLTVLIACTYPLYADSGASPAGALTINTKIKQVPDSNTEETSQPSIELQNNEKYATFADWLNDRNYYIKIDTDKERQTIREQWQQATGVDLFYPYFKIRELKIRTENKTKVKFFRLRGKARLEEDQAKYIFSVKF